MPLGNRLGGEDQFVHWFSALAGKKGAARITAVAPPDEPRRAFSARAAARAWRATRVGDVWVVAHLPAPPVREPRGRGFSRRRDAARGDCRRRQAARRAPS